MSLGDTMETIKMTSIDSISSQTTGQPFQPIILWGHQDRDTEQVEQFIRSSCLFLEAMTDTGNLMTFFASISLLKNGGKLKMQELFPLLETRMF